MTYKFCDPVRLSHECHTSDFDCGVESLNTYLKKYALQHQKGQGAWTYVVLSGEDIAGYFTLCYGSVAPKEAPQRIGQVLGLYPIPIMILARLAVDKRFQGQGLGEALLKHALLKTLNAAEIAGLRAVVVHAKDEAAKDFYKRYGFIESPIDAFHLFLLCKDMRHNL